MTHPEVVALAEETGHTPAQVKPHGSAPWYQEQVLRSCQSFSCMGILGRYCFTCGVCAKIGMIGNEVLGGDYTRLQSFALEMYEYYTGSRQNDLHIRLTLGNVSFSMIEQLGQWLKGVMRHKPQWSSFHGNDYEMSQTRWF